MRIPPPERHQWPLLAVAALAIVFAADAVARGQPRPPVQPPPRVNQRPRQQFIPPAPFQPAPFQPGVRVVTVYTCVHCGREVGRGPMPPAPPCPFCGFAGNPARVTMQWPENNPQQGWLAPPSPTLLYTVAAEGSLLAGMVLAGAVRLALDRLRRMPPVEADA